MTLDSGVRDPTIGPGLLVAHLEYIGWVTERILARVDYLSAGALTQTVESSFPTLLETLRHVYGWHRYYCIHLQGGRADQSDISAPDSYEQLRRAWSVLDREIISWATENLAARKDAVLDGWGIWPAWMVVLQMANHATHHFGQVVTLLRQLGYAPEKMESTDLIRYLLRRYPQEGQKPWLKAVLDRDGALLEGSSVDGPPQTA